MLSPHNILTVTISSVSGIKRADFFPVIPCYPREVKLSKNDARLDPSFRFFPIGHFAIFTHLINTLSTFFPFTSFLPPPGGGVG